MPLALIPWPAEVTTRPGALRLEASAPRDVIAQTHYEIDDTGSEGYRLRVDGHGIRLSSATAAGRFYGERTLRQLISRDEDGLFLPFAMCPASPTAESCSTWPGTSMPSRRSSVSSSAPPT
jgi:hypothetical protein